MNLETLKLVMYCNKIANILFGIVVVIILIFELIHKGIAFYLLVGLYLGDYIVSFYYKYKYIDKD